MMRAPVLASVVLVLGAAAAAQGGLATATNYGDFASAGRGNVSGVPAGTAFKFPLPNGAGFTESEWGIAEGDFEQNARIAALEIFGGEGVDLLVGGALDDVIDGGLGDDFILGGLGDDELTGGGGNDVLIGKATDVLPDRFEIVTRGGQSARNDTFQFAAPLPGLADDHAVNIVYRGGEKQQRTNHPAITPDPRSSRLG